MHLNKVLFWNATSIKNKIHEFKILSREKPHIPPLENSNNNLVYKDDNKADLLANTFSKVHSDVLASKSPFEEPVDRAVNEILNSNAYCSYDNITPHTIYYIISFLRVNKAPGIDKVTQKSLQETPTTILLNNTGLP